MVKICVPYKDDNLPTPKFRLYSITMNKRYDSSCWNIAPIRQNNEEIKEKFIQLQKYCEENHYENYPADFYLSTIIKVNNKPEYVEKLNHDTTSVFLGIFIKAFSQIKGWKFKEDWRIICATGNLEYNEDEPLHLLPIDNVFNKYNDEFTAIADKKYKGKKSLFLYISEIEDKNVPQGTYGDITVKWFSPDNAIEVILNYLFKPFNYKTDFYRLDSVQKDLLCKMENQKGNNFDYIQGDWFRSLEPKMFRNDWRGFFIHGKGGSGKSAAAMEIVRCLCPKKIYAPIWLFVNDGDIDSCLKKETKNTLENNILKKRDEIEAYITSGIEMQTGQIIDNLKNKIKELRRKYLIIIDNLELQENGIGRIIQAIKNIFPYRETRPYLVITSRYSCSYDKYLSDLKLSKVEMYKKRIKSDSQPEEEICKLTKLDIEYLIKAITENLTETRNKLDRAKGNDTFDELVEIYFQKYSDRPSLIIKSIALLEDMEINELVDLIRKDHDRYEDDLRNEEIKIDMKAFSLLDNSMEKLNYPAEKQVLYLFLEIGKEKPVSVDEINKRIDESDKWERKPSMNDLKKILRTLCKYKLINSIPSIERKTSYMIDSISYRTILFEKEFLGPQSESGEYLRDIFVNINQQLEMALRYDMDVDIVEPLLEKMKEKNIDSINYFYMYISYIFTATQFSSNIAVLNCLSAHVPDLFNHVDDYLHKAIEFSNTTVLDWLHEHVPELLINPDNYGGTVLFYATGNSNTAVLDWLYEHIPELLNHPDNNGKTVFHYAAEFNGTDVLDWLYKRIPELLNHPDNNGETVFHYAVTISGDTAVLDWLYERVPELLNHPDNNGETVFHYAVTISGDTDVLDWLYEHVPELLNHPDNNGETVFHYAVTISGYIDVLDWLYEHVPELLNHPDNNGETVFHYAKKLLGDIDDDLLTDVLDWLSKKAPDLCT
jgi:ankyrin repeat protein